MTGSLRVAQAAARQPYVHASPRSEPGAVEQLDPPNHSYDATQVRRLPAVILTPLMRCGLLVRKDLPPGPLKRLQRKTPRRTGRIQFGSRHTGASFMSAACCWNKTIGVNIVHVACTGRRAGPCRTCHNSHLDFICNYISTTRAPGARCGRPSQFLATLAGEALRPRFRTYQPPTQQG